MQESPYQYTIGYLFLKAKIINKYSYRLHLLGDPAMPMWTSEPKNLNISLSSNQLGGGDYVAYVTVNGLPQNQQALICLMKGEEVYATKTVTSENPLGFFIIKPRTPGALNITVTAHNYRPYEGMIYIPGNGSSSVHISEVSFNDSPAGYIAGNGNGKADAGETIEVTMKVKNSGTIVANNIRGVLRCQSEYITLLNDTVSFGNIYPQSTVEGRTKFKFRVAPGAPPILKNDFDAIKFFLDMKDSDGRIYYDEFNTDIFSPEIELSKPETNRNGSQFVASVRLKNTGKSIIKGLRATVSLDSNTAGVVILPQNISFPDIEPGETRSCLESFLFRIPSNLIEQPITLKLNLSNEYGKQWSELTYHLQETVGVIPNNTLKAIPCEGGVELAWEPVEGVKGYNVYFSNSGPTGDYYRINSDIVPNAYFINKYMSSFVFHYKVAAVSASGNEGALSDPVACRPCFPLIGTFPVGRKYPASSISSVNVADVDYDGKKEIFFSCNLNDGDKGDIVGVDYRGKEWIKSNTGYMNGMAKLPARVTGISAIGDLAGSGEQHIVSTTWNDGNLNQNVVSCFSVKDENNDNVADELWENRIMSTHYRGAVLANIDNSQDGTMETLVKGNNYGGVKILDNKGNLKREIGAGSTYSMPAVADLDGDGDKEIIACFDTGGIYIWHHDGTPYTANLPFLSEIILSSSPVICDINNDGKKVIIVAEKNKNPSCIYAVDLKGEKIAGWDGSQSIPYSDANGGGLDHMVSVGDINGDGKPEVVILGTQLVKAWKNDGEHIFTKKIEDLMPNSKWVVNKQVPILADIDGDSKADIILCSKSKVYALNGTGDIIPGFPMMAHTTIEGSPCVADIDNDGKNELIAVDTDGLVYAWKTIGSPNAIEWGSERHNAQNTGEYASICEPKLILTNTIWNGVAPCGNIIVQAGKFTVPSGKNLSLQKTSKIIVRPGATLEVNGGMVSNAFIWALPGSNVVLKNNGAIRLREGGNLIIDKGATLDHQYGSVQ